jgi:hypothetical protein
MLETLVPVPGRQCAIDKDTRISESEEDALREYYSGNLGTAEGGQL